MAATALLAGCGGAGGGSRTTAQDVAGGAAPAPAPAAVTAPLQNATVTIRSFQFGPATTAVKRGGTVTWRNGDSTQHTATADDRSFDSQTIDLGRARTVAFTTAGTFHYHCDFHPFMKGTVIVR